MLSGPPFRSAFVCSMNSLILSGFPLTSFHLVETSLSAFFVALYPRVCSCPKISRNVFYLELFTFLVLILQSTCFICITWKRKQTMEQQRHRPLKVDVICVSPLLILAALLGLTDTLCTVASLMVLAMTWPRRYLAQNYFVSITSLTWTLALQLLFCSVRRSLYGERK